MKTNQRRTETSAQRSFWRGALAVVAVVSAPSACALRHEIFEPEPGNPGPGALTCTEVRTPKGTGQQLATEHFRETWNADLRVVSEQYSSTDTFSGKTAYAWRYDARGNLVAHVGFLESTFQSDYRYDDRGNVTEIRGSNPGVPDVNTPSTADRTTGINFTNEYDGSTLVASTSIPFDRNFDGGVVVGTRRTFRQNELGQCDLIQSFTTDADTPTTTETRTYDASGRLETVKVAASSTTPWPCASWFMRQMYDDLGRLLEKRTWCGADDSGDADQVTLYRYQPDGSQAVEYMDFLSDTPNDSIETPNGTRSLTHWIMTRSSGCAAIDAAIGAPAGPECRVRDPEPRN
jgi:hypothetical protein